MEQPFNLKKLDLIRDIPTSPAILFKLNQMIEDENCSLRELSELIETDQALTSKILRLVNSAFYGFRSTISDMPHTVMMLGFSIIRNAIVTVSVIDAFNIGEAYEGFDVSNLWIHSIAVAVTSRHLAEKSEIVSPNDVFIGGLLHDIGKIIIVQYFRDYFSRIWKTIREEGVTFLEAETRLSDINHAHIGGQLAHKWKFPQPLIDVITFHHTVNPNVANHRMLLVVHFANRIVNGEREDSLVNPELFEDFPQEYGALIPYLENLSSWFPDVEREIDEACRLLLDRGDT